MTPSFIEKYDEASQNANATLTISEYSNIIQGLIDYEEQIYNLQHMLWSQCPRSIYLYKLADNLINPRGYGILSSIIIAVVDLAGSDHPKQLLNIASYGRADNGLPSKPTPTQEDLSTIQVNDLQLKIRVFRTGLQTIKILFRNDHDISSQFNLADSHLFDLVQELKSIEIAKLFHPKAAMSIMEAD